MELLKKLRISRRFALRGAVGGIGVSLWLPILESMCNDHGTAFAQGEPIPTSFGIFCRGNGNHPPDWEPTGDWELPTNLQAFAALKDDMTYITGLQMLDGQFKGAGWGTVYVLAGGDGVLCTLTSDLSKTPEHLYEQSGATQYMPTIDQIIADAVHTNEPFKSIETGVLPFEGDVIMGTVGGNLAHRGPNDYLSPERDPTKLFNTLFKADIPGSVGMPAGIAGSPGMPADISSAIRKSVLDGVLEDANRMKKIVGTLDAKRIDGHMQGIRELELRLPGAMGTGGAPAAGAGCARPAAPPITHADMTATSQALNRLIVAALACNLTRVYTHLWSGPRTDNYYPGITANSRGHHQLTQDSRPEEFSKIERYIMTQYADLAQVMKDTPMAAGNVLDHTLLYGVTEVADPRTDIMKDFRIVLMGHAGGQLPGNRYLNLPGRKLTELMLTMQQLMGLDVTTYGSWDRTSTTMPEILA